MERWAFAIAFGIAAFLALAVATEDVCSGVTVPLAFAVIAGFIDAVAGG